MTPRNTSRRPDSTCVCSVKRDRSAGMSHFGETFRVQSECAGGKEHSAGEGPCPMGDLAELSLWVLVFVFVPGRREVEGSPEVMERWNRVSGDDDQHERNNDIPRSRSAVFYSSQTAHHSSLIHANSKPSHSSPAQTSKKVHPLTSVR